jgi:hypothetical protein
MGCDVHMYAEKRNTNTNKWEKVGNIFIDDFLHAGIVKAFSNVFGFSEEESYKITKKYYFNLTPEDKVEEKLFNFIKENTIKDEDNPFLRDYDTLPFLNPFIDSPYNGRNYTLFGVLAGVRDRNVKLISDCDRGLPEDVSEEIRKLSEDFGIDGHSHNYLYLYEIIDSVYYNMTDKELDDFGLGTYFFRKTVDNLLKIGEPKDVRIVFWFDN